jgi:hypothetical protein
VQKTIQILKYFKPERWWLENPRNGLLKKRPYMQGIPFADADYCQYTDWGYQKPTRFWGSPDVAQLTTQNLRRQNLPKLGGRAQQIRNTKAQNSAFGAHQNLSPYLKYRIPKGLVEELGGFGEASSYKSQTTY